MAKYVGKVFKIPDRHLGIRGKGSHYVKISWFDPHEKIFHGQVITSLEEHLPKSGLTSDDFRYRVHKKVGDDLYAVVKKRKIIDIREGRVVPIPIRKAEGLKVWSGFSGAVRFNLPFLSKFSPSGIKIKK